MGVALAPDAGRLEDSGVPELGGHTVRHQVARLLLVVGFDTSVA